MPGCPAQPDNMTEALLYLVLHLGGLAPVPELDDQLRPVWLFGRTVREGCNRAGYTEQGQFATEYGDDPRCLVKLGCKGPVAKCNVPVRGWVNGIGGCPNVGGICIACTMPGFPDKFMPFMEEDAWGACCCQRHALHLRADPQEHAAPEHQEEVRRRAGMAAQQGGVDDRIRRSAGRRERLGREIR